MLLNVAEVNFDLPATKRSFAISSVGAAGLYYKI